jgi:hypothetical protein
MKILLNPGMIPSFMGGLGNQAFILVAAYVASKINKCPLYILRNPLSNNKHNLNKINYNNTLFKYFGEHVDQEQNDHFKNILYFNGYTIHSQPAINNENAFSPWNPSETVVGSIFTSYYQYYPPIKPFEEEIRQLMLKGLNEYSNLITIDNPENIAFLHIRRGDYLNHKDIHYIQNEEYYIKAVDNLLDKNINIKSIKVFSDDIVWARSVGFFKLPIFEIIDEKDELKTLHIMSQCLGGAICGNSTFSWWGAFLGAYSKRNPIFVPKNWIALKIVSLFPEEWIVI